jgi:putative Mg2+ transporter-C (MgtC) family protein
MHLAKIVEEQVEAFSLERLEEIIISIAKSELKMITWLGALLGGIIGFERYTHGRPAGFRTHIIVCVASVLIMMVSVDSHYLTKQNPDYIRIDPSRIAAGAITGIGFLGAGVIIKTGFIVQGLTTAACLWIVSAIGLAVGVGLYLPGIIATFITMIALWFLRGIEHKMEKRVFKQVGITTDNDDKEQIVEETLREAKADPGDTLLTLDALASAADRLAA